MWGLKSKVNCYKVIFRKVQVETEVKLDPQTDKSKLRLFVESWVLCEMFKSICKVYVKIWVNVDGLGNRKYFKLHNTV